MSLVDAPVPTSDTLTRPNTPGTPNRQQRAKAEAKAKGKRWDGSKPGRYVKVTPDQEGAVLKMVSEGVKLAKIARITGLSRPTIYRVLRNGQVHTIETAVYGSYSAGYHLHSPPHQLNYVCIGRRPRRV